MDHRWLRSAMTAVRDCLFPVALSWALTATLAGPARATGGDLDPTFSGDGKVLTNLTPGFDFGSGVAIQPDGKLVAAGMADGRFGLVRYKVN